MSSQGCGGRDRPIEDPLSNHRIVRPFGQIEFAKTVPTASTPISRSIQGWVGSRQQRIDENFAFSSIQPRMRLRSRCFKKSIRGGLTNRQGHRKLCDRFGNRASAAHRFSCRSATKVPRKTAANHSESTPEKHVIGRLAQLVRAPR